MKDPPLQITSLTITKVRYNNFNMDDIIAVSSLHASRSVSPTSTVSTAVCDSFLTNDGISHGVNSISNKSFGSISNGSESSILLVVVFEELLVDLNIHR